MSYEKPKAIAMNQPEGSYAAGCPAKNTGTGYECKRCDRAQ